MNLKTFLMGAIALAVTGASLPPLPLPPTSAQIKASKAVALKRKVNPKVAETFNSTPMKSAAVVVPPPTLQWTELGVLQGTNRSIQIATTPVKLWIHIWPHPPTNQQPLLQVPTHILTANLNGVQVYKWYWGDTNTTRMNTNSTLITNNFWTTAKP